MDPQLQARIDEARANGYSDQEINDYIASQGTPTPAETASAAGQPVSQYQPIDRSQEYLGLAQGTGLKALETGAELYVGYRLGKSLIGAAGRAMNGSTPSAPAAPMAPVEPAKPVTFTGGANPAFDKELDRPYGIINQAQSIVQKLALSKLLPAAQVGACLLYTSPEEIATLKAAEARKRALGQ
jgi:hypothetical protein